MNSLEQRNNADVDRVMVELEAAAESCEKSLAPITKRRAVRITIPFVGLSSEIDVPYRNLPRGTAGDLVVFIHKMLRSE